MSGQSSKSVLKRIRVQGGSPPNPKEDTPNPAEEFDLLISSHKLALILSYYPPEVVFRATLAWAKAHESEIEKIKKEVLNAESESSC